MALEMSRRVDAVARRLSPLHLWTTADRAERAAVLTELKITAVISRWLSDAGRRTDTSGLFSLFSSLR